MFQAIKNFFKKIKSFFTWKRTPAAPAMETPQEQENAAPAESAEPVLSAPTTENAETALPASAPESEQSAEPVEVVEAATPENAEPVAEVATETVESALPASAPAPAKKSASPKKEIPKSKKAYQKAQRLIIKGALPTFKENKGVRPNENAQSSLFVAKRNDQLKFIDERVCVRTPNVEITASGWEVSVYDEHTFNTLIYMTSQEKEKKFFDDFTWTSRKILKTAHRPTSGKRTYEDLEESIKRLASVTVFIKTFKKNYFGHLLEFGKKSNLDQTWTIRFPKEFLGLYAANCSQFNLDSQNRLLKNPIAAKLFGFYLSLPNGEQKNILQDLQEICGLKNYCELKEFKRRLIKALPLIAKEFETCGGNFEYGNKNKDYGFFKTDDKDENGHKIEFLKIIKVNKFKEISKEGSEPKPLPCPTPETA